jgi:hypothetical protein
MRAPFLLWANLAGTGAPLVAAAAVRRPLRGTRGWVLGWATLLLPGVLPVRSDPARMNVALQVEAVLCIIAFLAIAKGMTCPATT